jgi:hypothetical protein
VSVAQVGAAQVGVAQVGADQDGVHQMGLTQVRPRAFQCSGIDVGLSMVRNGRVR